jgi:DNA-binding CsgD family transcriptional regulator
MKINQNARKLGLSAPTIKFHVNNIFRKLAVRKRAAAVAEAHRRGCLS